MKFPHVIISEQANGLPGVDELIFTSDVPVFSTEPALRYAWNIVPGAHWPACPTGERTFVADLTQAAGNTNGIVPTRNDVTLLLVALRNNSTVEEMLSVVPGMNTASLLAAHQALTHVLDAAVDAWDAIVIDPSDDTIESTFNTAAPVMGATAGQLAAIRSRSEREYFISRTEGMSQMLRSSADEMFEALAFLPHRSREGVELGRLLFNGDQPAVFTDPLFIPTRIGELSAERAADLFEAAQ